MFRKRFAVLRFSLCAAGSLLSAPVLAGESAAAAITAFHATLTDSMSRSAKLGCEGRLKLVQPAVDRAFDLPFVAERALRRHWKTLTPAQRETFTIQVDLAEEISDVKIIIDGEHGIVRWSQKLRFKGVELEDGPVQVSSVKVVAGKHGRNHPGRTVVELVEPRTALGPCTALELMEPTMLLLEPPEEAL